MKRQVRIKKTPIGKKLTIVSLSLLMLVMTVLPSTVLADSSNGGGELTSEQAISEEATGNMVSEEQGTVVEVVLDDAVLVDDTDENIAAHDMVSPLADDAVFGTVAWRNNGGVADTTTIGALGTKTLDVQVKDDQSKGFKLTVTYENPDTSVPDSGFQFSNWTGKDSVLPEPYSSIDYNETAHTLTFIVPESHGSPEIIPNISLSAKASAYRDEQAKLSVQLFDLDGASLGSKELTIKEIQPQFSGTIGTWVQTGSTLLTGANSGKLEFLYTRDEGASANLLAAGVPISAQNTVIDLSNVKITIGGVTRTYRDYLDSGDALPIVFKHSNGAALTDDTKLTIANWQLSYLSPAEFSFATTADFEFVNNVAPRIDFSEVTFESASGGVRVGGRGPIFSFTQYVGNTLPDADANPYVAKLNVNEISASIGGRINPEVATPVTTPNQGYILYNSAQYKGDVRPGYEMLSEQLLCKVRINSTLPAGSSVDLDLVLHIPAGVAVSKLLMPQKYDAYTVYDSVRYINPDGSDGTLYTASGAEISIPAAHQNTNGMNITLRFKGFQRLKMDGYYGQVLNRTDGILALGYTDTQVSAGNNVTFNADVLIGSGSDATTIQSGNYSTKIVAKITEDIITSSKAELEQSVLLSPSTDAPIAAGQLNRGQNVTIGFSIHPHSYAISSTLIGNVSAYNGHIIVNPVVYISIPKGFNTRLADLRFINAGIKDYYGNEIGATPIGIYPNQGVFADDGGSVMEVKIHQKGNINGSVFIDSRTPWIQLRLDLTIAPDYNGPGTVYFGREVVYTGAWGDFASEILTPLDSVTTTNALANLTGQTIANAFSKVWSMSYTAANGDDRAKYTIVSSQSLQISGSARRNGSYISYNPVNNLNTALELYAGSSNEEMKVYISNELYETLSGDVYFAVPKAGTNTVGTASNWRAKLTDGPVLSTSGGLSSYTVYYTADQINDTSSLTTNAAISLNWTNIATTPPQDWSTVTAFRYSFSALKTGEGLTMLIPFATPVVNAPDINYNEVAVGRTLYDFGASHTSNGVLTAAIKLVRSGTPKIYVKDNDVEKDVLGITGYVDYKEAIPTWEHIYTYDDVTADITLKSVRVEFTPQPGVDPADLPVGFKTASDKTIAAAAITSPNTYQTLRYGYVSGYENELGITPTDYISSEALGSYRISYTTTDDFDTQAGSAVYTIVVRKPTSSISLTGANAEIFWDDAVTAVPYVSARWTDYFKKLFTGRDSAGAGGNIIPANLTLISPDGFSDITHLPGSYTLGYKYTDLAGNEKTADVDLTVKYRGYATGTARTTAGAPVPGIDVMVLNDHVTSATGTYRETLEATATSPLSVDYGISFDGNDIPDGLKIPVSSELSFTGLTADASVAPASLVHDLILTPITIAATLGTGNETGVASVSLYKTDGTLVQTKPYNAAGAYVFTPSTWFNGDYYVTVNLNPGYEAGIGGDYTQNGAVSAHQLKLTNNVRVGHDDINSVFNLNTRVTAVKFLLNYSSTDDTSYAVGDDANTGKYYGDVLTDFTDPVRTGYTFTGWYSARSGGSKWDFATGTISIEDELVLYAQWEQQQTPPPPVTPVIPPVTTDPDDDILPPTVEVADETQSATPATGTDLAEPAEPSAPSNTLAGSDEAKIEAQTGNIFNDIINGNVPRGSFSFTGAWSVLSLLMSIIAIVITAMLIIGMFIGRRKNEKEIRYHDDGKGKVSLFLRISAIIAGILTVVIWIVLDNLSQPIVWINKWTVMVGIAFIVHIILCVVYEITGVRSKREVEA